MAEIKEFVGAYEKAAEAGIDPRCIPQKLETTPPIDNEIVYPDYSEDDNDTWSQLYARQMRLLEGKACDDYMHGTRLLGFEPDRIPALSDLSAHLKKETGWRVARVPGLIQAVDFFKLLRDRIFPSTDYIRGKHEINYTPAPDLFHDIFGHMPLLTNPNFANFYQKFGEAALNAKGEQQIYLERFHWFTAEFGLIKAENNRNIYGAGILSSLHEVDHSLGSDVVIKPFDPVAIINQEYEVWHLQPILFMIDSFEQLEKGFEEWTKREGIL